MSDTRSTFDMAILDGLDARYGRGRGRLIVLAALLPGSDASARWALLETFGDAIVSEPVDKRGFGYDRHHRLVMDLGRGVTWTGRSLIVPDDLPETVLDEMVGRPLSDVAVHEALPADAIVLSTSRTSKGIALHTDRGGSVGLGDVRRLGPAWLLDALWLMIARGRFNARHGIALGPSLAVVKSAALGAGLGFCAACLVHLLTYPISLLVDPSGELGGRVLAALMMVGMVGTGFAGAVMHMLSSDMKGFDRINAVMVERFGRWTI
jgi:hypothetical protein